MLQTPSKRLRDVPAVLPEQGAVKQESSADPVKQPLPTDLVVRREREIAELPPALPKGEKQVVTATNKDTPLHDLTYEEYTEMYERVEAAWRLRKVEDLFMSSTQRR